MFSRLSRLAMLAAVAGALVAPSAATADVSVMAAPDLGPNVRIFTPQTPQATIQQQVNSTFTAQERNQFGQSRMAFLFTPGNYNVNVNVGYYTQVLGLGLSPDSTNITGSVHAEADWMGGNATLNFWRGAENLAVTPNGGNDRWAVSQAAPYRRMHLKGNLALDDGGWSSGGFIADTKVDGQIRSGSQQQWYTRDSQLGSWTGSNWNMVFTGVAGAPNNSFPTPPYTTVANTPVVRDKPFLYVDGAGNWQVFVPALRTNARGTTWQAGTPAGQSLPISQFFIVKPGTTASQINTALAQGQDLLVTPGVYHLNQTINITRPNTVVLGLGLATFIPDNGITAMSIADVDGVKVAGVLVDAGPTNSQTLVQVGAGGSTANHSANPTSLSDLFVRVGGAGVGKATNSVVINSNNVILDHAWIWRADHGSGVGWGSNTADVGLLVNGNNVTAYGLFVEHYQRYQTLWNGNGGRTYFYQNEMPYDPPNQAAWMNGATRGYAAYKVGANVTSHEAWGLGSYCNFSTNRAVVAERAFEVPANAGVRLHSLVTVSLGGAGTIAHVVNNTGGPSNSSVNVAKVTNFP